jgi:hypothetical protein
LTDDSVFGVVELQSVPGVGELASSGVPVAWGRVDARTRSRIHGMPDLPDLLLERHPSRSPGPQ